VFSLSGVLLRFFAWLVRSSLQASVLICLILAVQALLRRKLAPRWHYGLWLLVLARLVVPWTPESSLSVFNLLPSWQRGPAALAPSNLADGPSVTSYEKPSTGTIEEGVAPDAGETSPGILQDQRRPAPHFPFGMLQPLWLAGVLVFAAYALAQNLSLLTRVKRERPLTDQGILDMLEDCKAEMGVRAPLAVVETPKVRSPSLLGFVRPRLLVPEGMIQTLSPDELRFVFLHEMAHLKRWDIAVNWLITALQVLHWFNPLIWYAFYRVRADRELACDALVLSHTEPERSHEYGRTIVNLLERFSRARRLAGMAGILEDRSQLKRRIATIALFRKDSGRWSAVAIALLAVLACVALTDARTEKPLVETIVAEAPVTPTETDSTDLPDDAATVARLDMEDETIAAKPVALQLAAATPQPAPVETAEREGVGVALVEFSRVGSRETLGEASAQMYELVAARLAGRPDVRLVEREKLDKAFEELHLSQTGLVDAATATQVGKVVGARVFVVGRLMKLGSEWVVTARLIDTQTSEVAAVRVTGEESDGLLKLADAASDEIAKRLAKFTTAESRGESPVDADIERLRKLLAGKELPTVTVRVPESHLGRWVPDPAGENELISVLSKVGFRVVDISTFMKRQPSRWWLNIFHGRAQERDGTEIQVTQGFRSVADIMHDKRLDKMKDKTDIFIMGEAFSEYVGENYGFRSCRARIEVKAIDTGTETIAAAASQHATAADVGEFIAGKTALRSAGRLVAVQLAKELAEYWEENKGSREKVVEMSTVSGDS